MESVSGKDEKWEAKRFIPDTKAGLRFRKRKNGKSTSKNIIGNHGKTMKARCVPRLGTPFPRHGTSASSHDTMSHPKQRTRRKEYITGNGSRKKKVG